MAPRRGAQAEVEEEEPDLTSLQFSEPLSWRAGKPIATGELLRRLGDLAKELREMDQEETDKSSLTKVAKELAGHNLLSHKDRGVRAFTACCLVDILKICAPDAPFTQTQLKDIFTLFITSILPALSDPSNTYNTQHMYVLNSLAEVKSIVLLTDIPNADALTLHLFTSFFDIVSGSSKNSTDEQLSKQVEYNMGQTLVTIIDEAANLPPQVIDVVVAQFLRAASPGSGKNKNAEHDEKQSTLLLKELPTAYKMAATICNMCPEKMARYVSQYFNDVIMDASGSATTTAKPNGHRRANDVSEDSDDEDAPAGPTEADLRELHKAHKLLRELWRASPAVLQNVIPQLEAELSAENIQLRLLSTETLGDIISGIGAAGPPPPPVMDPAAYPPVRLSDPPQTHAATSILTTPLSPQSFAQAHAGVYQSFLGRKNDKSPIIRSGWTTAIGRILLTSAGGIGLSREEETTLIQGLSEKLNDGEERVRMAAVKAVGCFSFRDIMTHLASNGGINTPGSILSHLGDRARDRKHAVRAEAMTVLCKIWGVASGEIASGNESVIEMLGAIPSKVFDAYYANDPDTNVLMDHVMFEQLMPLNYPPTKTKGRQKSASDSQDASQNTLDAGFDADKIRTERILFLIRSLNARSKKAFFAMLGRQKTISDGMTAFIKRCEEYNGGVMDDNSSETKTKLQQLVTWLINFLPDNQKASADLFKYAKNHDRRTYSLLRFAMAPESDFKTVHNAIKEFSKRLDPTSGLLETLMPLVYRSSILVYNRSHLPAILQYSRSDEKGLGETAHEVLKQISERNPDVFKSHVKELCKLVESSAPSKTKTNDSSVVQTLKACSSYARKYPEEIPHDRKFIQALINFVLYSAPPKAAKYAVTILMAASERKEMHAKDLVQKVTQDWEYGGEHFLTKLASICQLTLLAPKVTEEAADDILDICTEKILLQARTEAKTSDPEWVEDSSVDEECQAKCWALKILVNNIRPIQDPETAKEVSAPVFKLLNTLVAKQGEISKAENTPLPHRSRLRLLAAQLTLKLCTTKHFDDLLTPAAFNRLAVVAQDSQYFVRRGFIDKLQKYLVQNRLSSRFHSIIFLLAFEPNQEFKSTTVTWIKSRAKVFSEKKANVLEAVVPRLLSLLAHHPDYSEAPDDLADQARYLLFYVQTVVNEQNLGLVFRYAQRVKQARDAINPEESQRLYVLSDLAQAVIRAWEEKKGWSMQTYGGKVGMPSGLFLPLPDHETAQSIADRQYLPEEMEELVGRLVKRGEKKQQKRKVEVVDEDGDEPVAKKSRASKPKPRTSTSKKASKPRTPAKAKKPARESSSAIPDSERRRSGRARDLKRQSYADRDSSEDDEEMLVDGVASWDYEDGEGTKEGDQDQPDKISEESDREEEEVAAEENGKDSDVEMAEAADETEQASANAAVEDVQEEDQAVAAASKDDFEISDDDEELSELEEEEPAPKTNGRKGGRGAAAPKPKPKAKLKAKATPKAKGKAAVTSESSPVPTPESKGKGKAKAKAKPAALPTRTSNRRKG